MNRVELIEGARTAAKHAKHNLRWIEKHPDRIDPSKREDMVAYLNRMIRFAEAEKKNARLAGLTRLRCRLSNLVVLIISQKRT